MIVPVILSGGAGTRLWPVSRQLYPKQFHSLAGDRTLLQDTAHRLGGLDGIGRAIVVCNHEHRFMVAEQFQALGGTLPEIFVEPIGRNTAPAVAVAALACERRGLDPLLLVLPADHVILDRERLHAAVREAVPWADADWLVTFGVVPRAAETGFGYIRRAAPMSGADPRTGAHRVAAFIEKPDRETAERYVADGDHYWNSGMFMFRASRYLEELGRFEPGILDACREAAAAAREDLDFTRLGEEAFTRCPANSIDYAVMEHTDRAVVVPLDAGWSDIGSWRALAEVLGADERGNVVQGDVLLSDVSGCYVCSRDRMVAALGLRDLVIVETADAVLVAHKDRDQSVKDIVGMLNEQRREEAVSHKQVFRPWGSYQGVDHGSRFQVKRLIINPGARISLQLHHKRSEHWVVVRGIARVVRGEDVLEMHEDESVYIPRETRHQLENIGTEPLEIVEVQTGSYLGEDDIVRFEDMYGRT